MKVPSFGRRTLGLALAQAFLGAAVFADPAPLPTLVLVELAGGLDGLNTVVPLQDPGYLAARKTLAVTNPIPLDAQFGLHPSLQALVESWKAGDLAIVRGVGYPDPNLSHFRSIAIWDSASSSREVVETGWLARLFSAGPRFPNLVADGLILGETHAGPLKGPGMHNLSFDNLDNFLRDANAGVEADAQTGTAAALAGVQKDVEEAARQLAEIKPLIREPSVAFPNTGLGRSMKTATQLLVAGARIPVIKLTLRGFDVHGNEVADQARLLKELADALAAFRANLIQAGKWDQTLVMTYSEFGRRVAENGSGGTDHGTANVMFLTGGRVKGGWFGTEPSLTDLDDGNFRWTVDFRTVFRSVAAEFWGLGDPALGVAFPLTTQTLDLVRPPT